MAYVEESAASKNPWGRGRAKKKSKLTLEQSALAIKHVEISTAATEVCRKVGISEATLCNGQKKFAGLGAPEVRRLKHFKGETRRLKGVVADLTLDKEMRQEVLRKTLKPARRRALAGWMVERYRVSVRLATALMRLA
ncbi:Transposase [Aquisalimonas asiatica]|uniref:Transposase n=1 Tax=Aquisalimonas asiatica TaxID=406100 RepID=A0A1H8QUM7_9GAMM|nr:Transposase [Aquisalimonas asiatica]